MGDVKWTEDQQKVINYRNRDILVSAAAGSGKTAVLVERIIKIITDKENPVDIDKLLVVTFTKAAAAEMRERISNAIDQQYEADPDNLNLEKQLTLVHNANITTIDSFCNSIVRNHFGEINLEPNFRIADQGELKLIQQDVISNVFESYYEEKDFGFLNLVDTYSNGNKDNNIRDMILKIANESESNPWPREWLLSLKEEYEEKKIENFRKADFLDNVIKDTKYFLNEKFALLSEMIEQVKNKENLEKVVDNLENYANQIEECLSISDYEEMKNALSGIKAAKWPTIKNAAEKELVAKVKDKRDGIKKEIEKIFKKNYTMSIDDIVEQMHLLAPFVNTIVDVTLRFMDEYEKNKRDKHVASFSDIEHFALRILVDSETKEITDVAKQYQTNIHEIMIDEYQDSNDLQEAILTAISKKSEGGHNLFMVGDIKQSIYRFRQAKPELFMEKYNRFDVVEKSKEQRIDLAMNFRSRIEVVNFVNDVFKKIMNDDLGNVTYDKDAYLYCGASYVESSGNDTEILLFENTNKENNDTSSVLEAKMIANRIKRLIEEHKVVDKATKQLRETRYSDIVILLRSTTVGKDFLKVLLDNGIPTTVQSQTGYFSSKEVQTMLAFLMILDNPYQDIPLVTVLKSEFANICDDELAELRISAKKTQFSYLVVEYCENLIQKAEEGEVFEKETLDYKLFNFWKKYKKMRRHVVDTSTHELIQMVYDEFNYLNYAAAMPAGDRREANLKMLLEKAIAYENTSYKGVFHFVRYIQQLKKYEIDFGEADVSSEDANEVKIMTIHKSKGLEFPIVFVSNINKRFNEADTRALCVLDQTLGLGIDERGLNPRYKKSSFRKKTIIDKIRKDNLGEELRILYVALTRAKEKLILTGCIGKEPEEFMSSYVGNAKEGHFIDYSQRYKANCYLDWIMPAILSYKAEEKYDVTFVNQENLVTETVVEIAENKLDEMTLRSKIKEFAPEDSSSIEQRVDFDYPFKEDIDKKIKYSVSEIKKRAMVEAYENELGEETPLIDSLKKQMSDSKRVPTFVEQHEEVENKGAKRGTAVHRLLQCIIFKELLALEDYSYKTIEQFVKVQIRRIFDKKLMTKDEIDLIYMPAIYKFLCSETALRMAKADKEENLFCEKPFVILYEEALVQGIIDVFWIEDGKIVLLDYKTDKVSNEDELIKRYKKQLELYEIALNRVFNVKNAERLIYSFSLDKVIKL